MGYWPVIGAAGLLGCAAASFFFALAESSLFSLGLWRARRLARQGVASGALVLRLLEGSQETLGTIVLGNTLANALLVALGIALATQGGWALISASLLLVATTLFVCEVVPKALGVRAPEVWAVRIARPMQLALAVSRPLRQAAQAVVDAILGTVVPKSITPVGGMSDEDYAELVELAHQQGTLAAGEKEVLLQILTLDRKTARDVMRPRSEMVMLRDDLPLEEMVAEARRSPYRRLPLYDETPDTVVGLLNTRTLLLAPEPDLAEAVEFPSFVPESMNLQALFEALQRQRRGLAIVLDEYGGVAGLVTLEDILERVIGEIRPGDEAPGFVCERLAPGRWRASGLMPLADLRREHPALGEVADVETLGGLVVKLAEVVPAAGESFVFRGLRLTVKQAEPRRVRELLVEVVRPGGTP